MGIEPNSPVKVVSGKEQILATALSTSIAHGSPEVLKILEEQDCTLGLIENPDGIISALVAACEKGNADLVGRLLALRDFPVSGEKMLAHSPRTDSLERAFHIATEASYESICHQLLSRGLSPRANCLDAAYRSRQPKLVELFTNVVDPTGGTFYAAMKTGKRKDSEDLLRLGVPIDKSFELNDDDIENQDLTALFPGQHHWKTALLGAAIKAQSAVVVDVLLAYGAQVNPRTGYDGPVCSLLHLRPVSSNKIFPFL